MESLFFRKLTEHEKLFAQWWGRWVIDLTDEELAAGGTSRVTLRAVEEAWKASALALARRVRPDANEPGE
jgi:hypothetical protein